MPRWCDVVELLEVIQGKNAVGDSIEQYTSTQVYANKKSVRQSEFYQAMAVGLKPEITFEVMLGDYSGQMKIRDNNRIYDVIRTYEKNSEVIEIVCTSQIKRGETDG